VFNLVDDLADSNPGTTWNLATGLWCYAWPNPSRNSGDLEKAVTAEQGQ